MRLHQETWRYARYVLVSATTMLMVAACGGGNSPSSNGNNGGGGDPVVTSDPDCNDPAVTTSSLKKISAVPANTLRIHYKRPDGKYTGWQVHSWNIDKDTSWPGIDPTGNDSYGVYYDLPVSKATGNINFIIHNGDATREPSNNPAKTGTDEQQVYDVANGKEIWKLAGDANHYNADPSTPVVVTQDHVRIHYNRADGAYTGWGLHLWEITTGKDIDTAKFPSGVTMGDWNNPVPFSGTDAFGAYADVPIKATATGFNFIIHKGDAKNSSADEQLNIAANGYEIWKKEGDATIYKTKPSLLALDVSNAKAYFASKDTILWPKAGGGTFKLAYATNGGIKATDTGLTGIEGTLDLTVGTLAANDPLATKYKYIDSPYTVLQVAQADVAKVAGLLKKQLVLVQYDAQGNPLKSTSLQIAGALDGLYAADAASVPFGVSFAADGKPSFNLWAPTAQAVKLCVYKEGNKGGSMASSAMTFNASNGAWQAVGDAAWTNAAYYKYLVSVYVPSTGKVEKNLVTDPYSVSLSANSVRSFVANLDSDALAPAGWSTDTAPATAPAQEDMSVYELHVRDFSINDATVPAAWRGKYMAFTQADSNGMKHLKALAAAGLTDVHLMPIFDIGTIPELSTTEPSIASPVAPDSEAPQAAVGAVREKDGFNWGYDPFHYTAPEGSYASNPSDGAVRVKELRSMIMALHQAGLRVGMDVVYNHTVSSGQDAKSVLDRIVPGYYQRLSATGGVETSTCCANTATENAMMAKLMIDSTKTWVSKFGIDSFRFDLMGHQPLSVMKELKAAVDAAKGKPVHILGEGWNFGEVANGARFVQASQLSLAGSGIGSFSDRARDSVRGGGPFDGGQDLVRNQGFINGLYYDDNGSGAGRTLANLNSAADMVRLGLSGTLKSYSFTMSDDSTKKGSEIDYGGQIAGYTDDPQEVVNYVENHDNQTLFDINAYKLPTTTSKADRARVQQLGISIPALSQGIAYYHAGIDTLRSKSMDRNSYDSGDWFNKMDWTYQDNNFAVGLPSKGDNGDNWSIIRPLLNNALIKPTATEIASTRDYFRDIMKVRYSSTLFRMRTAADVQERLHFYNVGKTQVPGVIAMHLMGTGYSGANFNDVMVLINVNKDAKSVTVDAQKGKGYVLHDAQALGADPVVKTSTYDAATGKFTVPARTTAVMVVKPGAI